MQEPWDPDGHLDVREFWPALLLTVVVLALALAVALLSGCVAAVGGGTINNPLAKPKTAAELGHAVGLTVRDANGPIAGAICGLDGADTGERSDAHGTVIFPFVAYTLRDTQLTCTAAGYAPFSEHRLLTGADPEPPLVAVLVALPPPHVDPSGIPLAQLAAIRGAMWPIGTAASCGALPFGPRPGQPDNIIATDFIANYSPEQRECIAAELKARGYTHVVMGPLVDSDGYHGNYTPHDWTGANFDAFLDLVQFFWDHGLAPVVFLHPDGWSFEQTRDALTPLLQQPRAQKLLRIVVPTGWEPTRYGWSSCTWALFAQWARATLPNALVLIHTVSDVDAPVGTDARCDDNGHPNGEGWARVVPYLHGWLIQNGPYAGSPSDDPQLARNFAAQFMVDGDGAAQHSAAWHFAGNAGWPTGSAWGATVPICLYNAENTAYNAYWHALPESKRTPWGDLAVASGACGYLDGGTMPVSARVSLSRSSAETDPALAVLPPRWPVRILGGEGMPVLATGVSGVSMPVLRHGVADVVALRPKEQMLRPDAIRNIAPVQDFQTDRDSPIHQLPGEPMRSERGVAPIHPAVSVLVSAACPKPAAIGLLDGTPEPLNAPAPARFAEARARAVFSRPTSSVSMLKRGRADSAFRGHHVLNYTRAVVPTSAWCGTLAGFGSGGR